MWINFLAVAGLISLLLPPTACQTCIGTEVACDGRCATPCDGFIECNNKDDETSELCSNVRCTNGEEFSEDLGSISDILGEASSRAQAQFRCNYGGCINKNFVCNGQLDCWDGSDETRELCFSKRCSNRQFKCDSGGCIGRLWKCNGLSNCMDGSDETLALCKDNRCYSNKFKCNYGGCIDNKKKCNGVEDCNDGSDETQELCGASHTVATTIAATPITSPTPPVTQPPPAPSTDIIIIQEGTKPLTNGCARSNLCPCPYPNTHFCVPCSSLETCNRIEEVGVCSIEAAAGSDPRITVDILACGIQPVINIAGLVRQHGDSTCGTDKRVPVLSIVTADCWGTRTLMQCQADAKWHPYGGLHTIALPATHLCQPQAINSPVCGYRPRYAKNERGYNIIRRQPQWPWLVGLMRKGKYICAATIISPHFLLTAAHCLTRTKASSELEDVRNLRIQRLNHFGHVFIDFISNMYVFPGYKGGNIPSDDLALVRVENEIFFSAEVFPACVLHEEFPQDKIAATFNRSTDNYQWDLIQQLYDTRCYAPSNRCSSNLAIGANKFCGIDKESQRFLTPGSSGGPYLVNMGNDAQERWTVAGVVSSSRSEGDLCPRPFTIFTNVRYYWTWVADCVHNGGCM